MDTKEREIIKKVDTKERKVLRDMQMEISDLIEKLLAMYEYISQNLIPERKNDDHDQNPAH